MINDAAELPHELKLIGPNTYISKTHAGEVRMTGHRLTVLRGDPDRSDGAGKMGFLCLQPIKRKFLGFFAAHSLLQNIAYVLSINIER